MDGLDAMLKNGPWFIQNNSCILKKWHPDENVLKEDVSIVLVWVKLHGVPVMAFSEDGLSVIATKLGTGEKNIVKKPSLTSRGVSVGPKMGFKHQKEYRHVPKKPTASSSVNNKKGVKPTIEVSNSNPFDVLNSVDNDVEFGTNGGLLNCGQAILMDKDGNILKRVEFPGEYDSEDEVASVDNDMARSMASERVGFGTQSLLKQLRDSYGNGDYDDDPYDVDMYEGQDLSQDFQAICDNLDIRVRGRKKIKIYVSFV
nr:hypothetical protein [Tanacetum cinerariifolium]